MGDFTYLAFSESPTRIEETWSWMRKGYPDAKIELWEIERDKHGNKYVIIQRVKQPGRNPKLAFKKKLKEA